MAASGAKPRTPPVLNERGNDVDAALHTGPTTMHAPWYRRFRAFEWLVTLVVFATAGAVGVFATPYCREFRWDDASIAHPMKPNTFPVWSLIPISALPVAIYAGVAKAAPLCGPAYWADEAVALALMQFQSVALSQLVTQPTKIYAGRLRPDFLARLTAAGYGRVNASATADYCTVRDRDVRQGRCSFPSGHSSTSFAAMVPLAAYLLFRFAQPRHGQLLPFLAAMSPIALAVVVATSRTRDEWHHFGDIVAGSVIGLVAGLGAYHAHNVRVLRPYPPLTSSSSSTGGANGSVAPSAATDGGIGNGAGVVAEYAPRVLAARYEARALHVDPTATGVGAYVF